MDEIVEATSRSGRRAPGAHVPGLPRRSAPPVGRLTATGTPAEQVSGIVDCALYETGVRRGGRVPIDVALKNAREVGDGFVWIGLHEPTAEEFDDVARHFGLHPLAVEDAVHAHQRPKLEVYGDIVFVVLKTVRYVDSIEVVDIGELMLFLGAKFVVAVRHGSASPLTEVRRSLEANPELLRTGPSAVLYAVADHVVDQYTAVVNQISEDIDEIGLEVFTSRANVTERLYKLKREVMEFRRAVRPLAGPMERITRGEITLLDPRTIDYFRDVNDHLLKAAEQVESFDELLSGALSAHLAQLQMDDNQDMRKITAWVAILAANTLVAGVYGMNFERMPELTWTYGYPMVLVLMVVISVVLYRGFRRNHWL